MTIKIITPENTAVIGIVKTQAQTICFATPHFTFLILLDAPTPIMLVGDDDSDVPEPDDSGDAPEDTQTDDDKPKDGVQVPAGKKPSKKDDEKKKQEKRSLEVSKLYEEIGGMADED